MASMCMQRYLSKGLNYGSMVSAILPKATCLFLFLKTGGHASLDGSSSGIDWRGITPGRALGPTSSVAGLSYADGDLCPGQAAMNAPNTYHHAPLCVPPSLRLLLLSLLMS
jgi:hypothetical protein